MDAPLAQIVQLTGVGLAGFIALGAYKIISNHISHNTEALHDLVAVIRELKEWLQNHQHK